MTTHLEYADLHNAAKYVPNACSKTRSQGRLRAMLTFVRFLSQPVHNPCHEYGGTYVVMGQAQKIQKRDLELLVEWFPDMNFVFVADSQLCANTVTTTDGRIDGVLASKLGEQYGPYVWYISANTKLEDESTRQFELRENNIIIARMKPLRALVPFRHAYVDGKQVVTLRYNSPLWLQPWTKPAETITMLNYREGDIMLPCETPLEYEQKMFYWNRYVRTGTTPARPTMRGIGKYADLAIQNECLSLCPRAAVMLDD